MKIKESTQINILTISLLLFATLLATILVSLMGDLGYISKTIWIILMVILSSPIAFIERASMRDKWYKRYTLTGSPRRRNACRKQLQEKDIKISTTFIATVRVRQITEFLHICKMYSIKVTVN